jgi:hypothetical protein
MSSSELLRAAAEALDEGTDPFCQSFLAGHDVTFDQCMVLGRQLAIGARMVARAIERPRSAEGTAMFATIAREPA